MIAFHFTRITLTVILLMFLTGFQSTHLFSQDTDGTHFYWVTEKTGDTDEFLKKYGPDYRGDCLHYLARVDGMSLQRGSSAAFGAAKRENNANWQGFKNFIQANPNFVVAMNSGLMNKSWEFTDRSKWSKNWSGDIGLIINAKAAGVTKVVMFMQSPLSKGGTTTFDPNIINETQPNGGATLDQRVLDCVTYADYIEANKPDGVEVTYGLIDAFPAKTSKPADEYHKAYVDLAKAFKAKDYVLEEIQFDMKTQTVSNGAYKLLSACERAYNEIFQATGQKVRMSWYTWWGFNDDPVSSTNTALIKAFGNISNHSKAQYMSGLLLDGNKEDRNKIEDIIPSDVNEAMSITARVNQAFSYLENLGLMNPTQKGDSIIGSNNTGGSIVVPKPKPSSFAILVKSSTELNLSWEDNIGNETGFIIERTSDKASDWEAIDTTAANTTSFTDTGLEPFLLYSYRLKAMFEGDTLSGATDPILGRPSIETHAALPDGWKSISLDEEETSMASTSTFALDTFTIDAGDGDFWTENSKGHFIYQSMVGDGEIIAQLVDFSHVNGFSMAGLMMSETLDNTSKFAAMLMMSGPGPILRDRVQTAGATNQKPYPKTEEKAPYWLKLVRTGTKFSGYISENNQSWKLIREIDISMANNIFVGMAAASHTIESNGLYKFSDLELNINTAIKQTNLDNLYKTYYNNAINSIAIETTSSTAYMVNIYDINSRIVLKTNNLMGHAQLLMSPYSKGIYFIEIADKNKRYINKIIVQ